MPDYIDIIVTETPTYIDVAEQQSVYIDIDLGGSSVTSVNSETGVVLVNAVPDGGTTGQVLAKASNTDNDTEWVNQSGGGNSNRKIYKYQNTDSSVTGTTAETILTPNTFFVEAGDMSANGVTDIVAFMRKDGVAGTAIFNIYLNSSYSLSGAQLLFTSGSLWSGSIKAGGFGGVRVVNKNSLSSQTGNSISSPFFETFSTSTPLVLTANFSNRVYVIITGKANNAGDTVTLGNCQLYVNNP